MKRENMGLSFLAIFLLLCSFGCEIKPVTSAISADGVKIIFANQGK